MGYEHHLRLPSTPPLELDAILRGIRGFETYDAEFHLYMFRRLSTNAMPDAQAKLEIEGIYFCDNGSGQEILADLINALESRIGPVEATEL
jgi:hypothetical protein